MAANIKINIDCSGMARNFKPVLLTGSLPSISCDMYDSSLYPLEQTKYMNIDDKADIGKKVFDDQTLETPFNGNGLQYYSIIDENIDNTITYNLIRISNTGEITESILCYSIW